MIPALKSEALKLLSVRSTLVIAAIAGLLIIFFAGYVEGFKAAPAMLKDPGLLAREVTAAINFSAVFAGLIAILLFSHEYRYNTIMHTLVSSNRRSKVLLAKILVTSLFAVVFAVLVGVLSPLATTVGLQLANKELVEQVIPYSDLIWRSLLFIWGYAMIGLLFVALVRNQVLAIGAMFIIPTTIEPIAGALLKKNAEYLPFNALSAVIGNNPDITHARGAAIFLAHIVFWWLLAWLLFLRRDAN
jgi:ABC-2 type transport system permease protein